MAPPVQPPCLGILEGGVSIDQGWGLWGKYTGAGRQTGGLQGGCSEGQPKGQKVGRSLKRSVGPLGTPHRFPALPRAGTAVAIPPVIQQREPPHGKVVQSGILRKTTPSPGRLAKESCFSATCWLDTTDASGCLDPVFVLKLFERGRTNAFDGPSGLKTLQVGHVL